ncbi:riboflavin kinase [Halohasta litchfieldiae]|uniref:Riboflavin kinase n=2 Tax=Halohasta litchfieldiae TaxID=1073996 RepID=A0A1H6QX73_9EURY|nr:riboflavin kinase [Halohasta litchfieldiae]SEI46666.1 CTP-dependent riboflavin kinase [Halohasta litchfieldiae]
MRGPPLVFGMSESAVTSLGHDELQALKAVGLDGGLSGSVKVSCASLAERLDTSTQTASRRLQQLESSGFLDREIVSDGQWVSVTETGQQALRSEYADYRRLFEEQTGLTLTGTITTGMGEGRHYISLPGYKQQFESRLGYTPFPGTLNVELSEASIRGRADLSAQASVPIDSWEDDERTFGAATCYPARLEANGRQYGPTHVIVPDRTHHDEESLELIAPEKLRDELNLTDDDTLSIHLEEASTE